jgi:hypothetical protein
MVLCYSADRNADKERINMSQLDSVIQSAKQVLSIQTLTGRPDNSLWDRAQRVVRNIEHICRLPELHKINSQVDLFCLTAAAYFCDAGFTRLAYPNGSDLTGTLPNGSLEDSHQSSLEALTETLNTDNLRRLSTEIVTERLEPILPATKIDKINKIIIESGSRFTNMTEAMILFDARNLDDIGTIGIFNEFRRCPIHGKAVTDVLQSWKRKIDYRYWQARLKESFHFETVRGIAARRLGTAEAFMKQLSIENSARDLEKELTTIQR